MLASTFKLIFFFVFLFTSLNGLCQSGKELIRIHNVSDIAAMNATSAPLKGNIIYVQSTDNIYYYDGSNWVPISATASSGGWELTGNTATSSDFLGTTNNSDLDIRTNNIERMTIKNDGKVGVNTSAPTGLFQVGANAFTVATYGYVGIGTTSPTQRLHVIGNILATGTITPDYVFEHYFEGESKLNPDYTFTELEETIEFTKKYHHLPGIPSAKEVEKQGGILVNKAVEQNLEKIEELYLHLYELHQKKDSLKVVLQQKIKQKEKVNVKQRIKPVEAVLEE